MIVFSAIQDLEYLLFISSRILLRSLPWFNAAARVAFLPLGSPIIPVKVANQKDHVVTELLEMPHLVDEYRVPDVQIWRSRVEAHFDIQ